MYVCMVRTFSRVWINLVRLPIVLVTNSTGDKPVPVRAGEFGLEDGFGRPVPLSCASLLILHTQAGSAVVAFSRNSSRFPRRRPTYYTVNRRRVSRELIRPRFYLRMTFTAERPTAQVRQSQGSSTNGFCLFFRYHHGPSAFVRLSFSTPHPHELLLVHYTTVGICNTECPLINAVRHDLRVTRHRAM